MRFGRGAPSNRPAPQDRTARPEATKSGCSRAGRSGIPEAGRRTPSQKVTFSLPVRVYSSPTITILPRARCGSMSIESDLDDAPAGTGDSDIEATMRRVAAAIRPGWIVLHDCALGDADHPLARAEYALIHPHVGIALLDLPPRPRNPAAAERLRRALEAAEFPERFGGQPPIVYLHLPARSLAGLGPRLDRAFDLRPPLALSGGDAWVVAAQGVLKAQSASAVTTGSAVHQAEAAVHGPLPLPPGRGGEGGACAAQGSGGRRALGRFWGALLLVLGGGVAVLHYLGPPEGDGRADHASAAPSSSSPPPRGMEQAPAAVVAPVGAARPGGAEQERGFGPAQAPPSLAALLRELSEPEPPLPSLPFPSRPAPAASGAAMMVGGVTAEVPLAPWRPGIDPTLPPGGADGADAPVPAWLPPAPEAGALSTAAATAPAPPPGSGDGEGDLAEGEQVLRQRTVQLPSGEAQPRLDDTGRHHASAAEPPTPPPDAPAAQEAAQQAMATPADSSSGREVAAPSPSSVAALAEPPAVAGPSPVGPSEPAVEKAGPSRGEPVAAALTPAVLDALIRRGDAMVAAGDISAARLLYGRAAAAGSGRAAAALGRTYDPDFLAGIRASIHGDPDTARAWHQRAVALGDRQARGPLDRQEPGPAR